MAAPSLTGTASTTEFNGTRPADLTMTVPADAEAIVVDFAGFEGTTVTVTSVQGDPTGTPYDLDDLELYGQRTNAQYSGRYAIYDTNSNWPGTGSVTVRITLNRTNAQLKGTIYCLKDLGDTPVNSSGHAESAGATPSSGSITSSSNALNIAVAATYSADISGGDDTTIGSIQNGGSASSMHVWSEAGTGSTDTVEGNASVAYHMTYTSFEGTSDGGLLIPQIMHHRRQMS